MRFEVRPNPETGGFEVWGTEGSGRWAVFADERMAGWHARQLDAAYERGRAGGAVRTEWGLMLDCAANGCAEPHEDAGEVMLRKGDVRPVTRRVNGHAVRVVSRTVATSDWRVAGEAGER